MRTRRSWRNQEILFRELFPPPPKPKRAKRPPRQPAPPRPPTAREQKIAAAQAVRDAAGHWSEVDAATWATAAGYLAGSGRRSVMYEHEVRVRAYHGTGSCYLCGADIDVSDACNDDDERYCPACDPGEREEVVQ